MHGQPTGQQINKSVALTTGVQLHISSLSAEANAPACSKLLVTCTAEDVSVDPAGDGMHGCAMAVLIVVHTSSSSHITRVFNRLSSKVNQQ